MSHSTSFKDGLPHTRPSQVHRFVTRSKSRVGDCYLNLPPYSPQINPDELVSNDVKNQGVAQNIDPRPQRFAREVSSRLRLSCKKIQAKFARRFQEWKRRVMQPHSS